MLELNENLIFMMSVVYLTGFALGWKIGLFQKATNTIVTGVN